MNRPVLIIALIALLLCGLFFFIAQLQPAVMPLLIIGAIALVISVATGR